MKKWNVVFGIAAAAVVMGACKCDREQLAKGVITEASMNTMTVATQTGDSLLVSTMDAERVSPDGILLGDTATVYYKTKENGMVMATKVVVVPGVRECTDLLGTWVQPIEGMAGQVQGIRIETGGAASSVNMATLLYEGWKKQGDNLILNGKSLGNGQTIVFADTLHIDRLTADSLVVSKGEYIAKYSRGE